MLPDPNIELTPEQIDQLEQAGKIIPKIKEQIRRAKLAGLDVSALEEQLSVTERDLASLSRVYGRRSSNRQ